MTDKPWENEPDEVHWVDEETGYDCWILRPRKKTRGHLCGYVGIPAKHPCYEKEYDDLNGDISVHGGLTFSEFPLNYTCLDPNLWYFGFDCAHYNDLVPNDTIHRNLIRNFIEGASPYLQDDSPTYKTIGFVKNELKKLVKQLKEIEDAAPIHQKTS